MEILKVENLTKKYGKNENEVIEKIESIIQKDDIIYFKGSNAMNVNKIIEHLKEDFMN